MKNNKMPEFYIKISRKILFPNCFFVRDLPLLPHPLRPPSVTPMHQTLEVAVDNVEAVNRWHQRPEQNGKQRRNMSGRELEKKSIFNFNIHSCDSGRQSWEATKRTRSFVCRFQINQQEQQRVAVGPRKAHFISVRQVSSDAGTLRRGHRRCAAAAAD